MRFDDSLKTVLAADTSNAFGAASAWRQLVDLIGRGRAGAAPEALERLRMLRGTVPEATRAASARALAFAAPGPELVALFAEDTLPVAAPVLRIARLEDAAWLELLPRLSPAARAVLRHRRDLPLAVTRGLEQFGSVDFVLSYDGDASETQTADGVAPGEALPEATSLVAASDMRRETAARIEIMADVEVVAEPAAEAQAVEAARPAPNGFPISELVARIDAYQRRREQAPAERLASAIPEAMAFRFTTDSLGAIDWVDGTLRSALIGVSLAHRDGVTPSVDGVAAGALRRRSPFADARLTIAGASIAAGAWRISGEPMFDPASGRFTGYRGVARRPRRDESAPQRARVVDSLRQLVHELRTPANAIAGFAELIESELLGSAPAVYRERAGLIREQAAGLIDAIDDLDAAARLEAGALELRPGAVRLAPLLERIVADLVPLARLRGARLILTPPPPALALEIDDRAGERLLARLLSVVVGSAAAGERVAVTALREGAAVVLIAIDRPAGLAAAGGVGLFSFDDDEAPQEPGAPLLGSGFALRLARNLAAGLGGSLRIEPARLTLRLPAAVTQNMGQVSIS